MNKNDYLVLPCLKGRIGDWVYYVSVMQFQEISKRVKRSDEIHRNRLLSDWIQRQLKGSRTAEIVSYLKNQPQRFFNAIILGIHGGEPAWQEIDIENNGTRFNKGNTLSEKDIEYLNRTFGILTLTGEEKIFAIDGQHRTTAIEAALQQTKDLSTEEVAVIFVAHKHNKEGRIRTRRLFSTLNRYARPVSLSEIIALDEEDNVAIITRQLMEEFELFANKKILFSKGRSINPNITDSFTNIVTLYDIVTILLTNKQVLRIKSSGEDYKKFVSQRAPEPLINRKQKYIEEVFTEVVEKIPSLKKFFRRGYVDREKSGLLFRPIGQIIFFSVLKIAIDNSFKNSALKYFAKEDFMLSSKVWGRIFLDKETGNIKTDKTLQKFAISLILKHLKFEFKETKKDREIFDSFKIDPRNI